MAGLLTPPGHTFTDDNGRPLASGKVYTYVAGTSTPKDTYADQAESSTLANPVILDPYGRKDIWIANDTLYKIVIKDSLDNIIATADNVAATGGSFSTGIVLAGNLDTNGYSITSNSNQDITISPHGTGRTQIYDPVFQDNLDLNGNNIIVTNNTGLVQTSSGNEILMLDAPASAVNYVQVSAAATGNAVKVSAKGDDTNIDLNLVPKGTGVVGIEGTADASAELRLYEDTDNGTNYVGLKAPASLASNVSFTLPSADGTANQVVTTNGSGVLSFTNLPKTIKQLATYSPSSASSVDITSIISSSYKVYEIHILGMTPATDNVLPQLLVSTDNGSSWSTTSYAGGCADMYNNTYTSLTPTAYFGLTAQNVTNTAPSTHKIVLQDPTNTSYPTCIHVQGQSLRQATDYICIQAGGGSWTPTTAVNAVRIKYSSGNISSGYIIVYGYEI